MKLILTEGDYNYAMIGWERLNDGMSLQQDNGKITNSTSLKMF